MRLRTEARIGVVGTAAALLTAFVIALSPLTAAAVEGEEPPVTTDTSVVSEVEEAPKEEVTTEQPAEEPGVTEDTEETTELPDSTEEATPAPESAEETEEVPAVVAPRQEVAIYFYKLLDPTKPPSWHNSGKQFLCDSREGNVYFTSVSCVLPADFCGPNIGAQHDGVQNWGYDGPFLWPATIEYPDDNIGWPPLYKAYHGWLSDLMTVPDCAPPPPDEIVAPVAAISSGECYFDTDLEESFVPVSLEFDNTASNVAVEFVVSDPHGDLSETVPAGELVIVGTESSQSGEEYEVTAGGETFQLSIPSFDGCAPEVELPAVRPVNVTFSDVCGVTNDSFIVPGELDGDPVIIKDPVTGTTTTYSTYVSDQGGYEVTDTVTKDGVRSVLVLFIQFGKAVIAEPGPDDTYTIELFGQTRYAQWTFTFTNVQCPIVEQPPGDNGPLLTSLPTTGASIAIIGTIAGAFALVLLGLVLVPFTQRMIFGFIRRVGGRLSGHKVATTNP